MKRMSGEFATHTPPWPTAMPEGILRPSAKIVNLSARPSSSVSSRILMRSRPSPSLESRIFETLGDPDSTAIVERHRHRIDQVGLGRHQLDTKARRDRHLGDRFLWRQRRAGRSILIMGHRAGRSVGRKRLRRRPLIKTVTPRTRARDEPAAATNQCHGPSSPVARIATHILRSEHPPAMTSLDQLPLWVARRDLTTHRARRFGIGRRTAAQLRCDLRPCSLICVPEVRPMSATALSGRALTYDSPSIRTHSELKGPTMFRNLSLIRGALAFALAGFLASVSSAADLMEVELKEDVVYGTGAGDQLKLDLAKPREAKEPLPGILFIHGGGWQAGNKKVYRQAIQEFAANGYIVGSVGYRFAPKHRTPAQIEDVKCAVRWMRANAKDLNLKPEKIGAIGASAGGHLATMLGVMDSSDGCEGEGGCSEHSSKVQCVVNYFGPTNLTVRDLEGSPVKGSDPRRRRPWHPHQLYRRQARGECGPAATGFANHLRQQG